MQNLRSIEVDAKLTLRTVAARPAGNVIRAHGLGRVLYIIGAVRYEQPLGARHHLEVALQPQVQLGSVDHRAGAGIVGHLLQGHRRAQHVAGELACALGIALLDPHGLCTEKPRPTRPSPLAHATRTRAEETVPNARPRVSPPRTGMIRMYRSATG